MGWRSWLLRLPPPVCQILDQSLHRKNTHRGIEHLEGGDDGEWSALLRRLRRALQRHLCGLLDGDFRLSGVLPLLKHVRDVGDRSSTPKGCNAIYVGDVGDRNNLQYTQCLMVWLKSPKSQLSKTFSD